MPADEGKTENELPRVPEGDQREPSARVPSWVWILVGFLVAVVLIQSLNRENGSSVSESVAEVSTPIVTTEEKPEPEDAIDTGNCLVDGGYLAAAGDTASSLGEMSGGINDAVTIGTEQSLRAIALELRTIYGPRFSSLSRDWSALPSCGDTEIDALVAEMANYLASLGALLSQYEYGNIEDLQEASVLMEEIGTIASLITERI